MFYKGDIYYILIKGRMEQEHLVDMIMRKFSLLEPLQSGSSWLIKIFPFLEVRPDTAFDRFRFSFV